MNLQLNKLYLVMRWIAVALSGLIFGASVHAQSNTNYPNKPIRIIIPQSSGSATDSLIRLLAPKLSEQLGQSLILENKAGAGGVIGADYVSKSAPDGYTLLMGATSWITIAPFVNAKLPYDPQKDLSPISLFAVGQNVLTVSASSDIFTVRDLLAKMKANPTKLNMASAGIGSTGHVAGVLLTSLADVSATHVPYKGTGPAVTSVLSGESNWIFTPVQGPIPFIKAGKLRAIAVGGATRSALLPDVPTVKESGLTGYDLKNWYGLLAPAGTPSPILQRVQQAITKAISNPELQNQFFAQGAEPSSLTPAEFAAFIKDETEKMAKVIKIAGLTQE